MELFFLNHGSAISILMMIAGAALIKFAITLMRKDRKDEAD